MTRRIVPLPCGDGWIMATIDGPADATRGWVMATGGSQTRVGAHRLYERLAMRLAARREAVVRFDRRGVGDSPGEDRGYAAAATELAAAVAGLRAHAPAVADVRGFGLCDGATALALCGGAAGIGRLVLANPWVVEANDALPPAAAVRGHYRDRLLDPAAWWRLVRGGVDLRRLGRGLVRAVRRERRDLAERVAAGVPDGSVVVLAERDGTARVFADAWRRLPVRGGVRVVTVASASHGFAEPTAFDDLLAAFPSPNPLP